jgi:hypothetical protein
MTNILLYIDPGSGSLIFQALLSGFLTLLVFYKKAIAYVKSFFSKNDNKAEEEKFDQ